MVSTAGLRTSLGLAVPLNTVPPCLWQAPLTHSMSGGPLVPGPEGDT